MRIVDTEMALKMARALKCGQNLYTLGDIENGIATGNMQSHVVGRTWAVTEVSDFPEKRVVNILFVVGSLDEALNMEQVLTEWSKSIGASLITAVGRDGWWENRLPGWRKSGTFYTKELL